MRPMRGRWMKTGATLLLGIGLWSFVAVVPVTAGQAGPTVIDARDLVARLQRLERDMRDLQAETYRRSGRPLPPGGLPSPVIEPPQPAAPDFGPLMRRMGELEESFSRLTGQIEELGHQVDQLGQRTDRLQREMEYQSQQANRTLPGENAIDPGQAVASLAPELGDRPPLGAPPRNLGQLPDGTRLPAPAGPADPREEFANAMTLLSRAQYNQASDAFRAYAENHPDEPRAADALYWTGDIAYSAKKDYTEAAREFAELLKKYPTAQRAPEGMLKLSLALFQLGQTKEGCAALAALPAKYPAAPAAVATRARNERRDRKC